MSAAMFSQTGLESHQYNIIISLILPLYPRLCCFKRDHLYNILIILQVEKDSFSLRLQSSWMDL